MPSAAVQLWNAVAVVSLFVKVTSTVGGLLMRRNGDLLASRRGRWVYTLSKLSPIMAAYALFRAASFAGNALDRQLFGWMTLIAMVLVTVVVSSRLICRRNW